MKSLFIAYKNDGSTICHHLSFRGKHWFSYAYFILLRVCSFRFSLFSDFFVKFTTCWAIEVSWSFEERVGSAFQ